MTGSASDGPSLVELLDERRLLLARAFEALSCASRAEDALLQAYGRWFGLTAQERAHISPARPWLIRLVDRICADGAPPGPITQEVVAVASAPSSAMLRVTGTPPRHDGLVNAFAAACQTDDHLALAAILAPAVTVLVDGGGRLRIDPSPVHGLDDVSRLLRRLLGRQPELVMAVRPVNGAAGVVVHRRAGAEVVAVVSLDVIGDCVHRVCVVLNPDKLRSWNHH
jgi:RNA polymerase sigma-70 factor (ECF subfamily)